MTISELLTIISSIKPDKHIIAGRNGSEENVKNKITIPLLQYLGYNLVENMDFELLSADIVLLDDDSKPILIVETKSWEELLTDHLDQCLEYTFKLRCPFIMITSGKRNALYSSFINCQDLNECEPIFEFDFDDLLGNNSEKILLQLEALIGKNALIHGAKEINEKIVKQLPSNKMFEDVKREFFKKCSEFKSEIKTKKINEDEFMESAKKHLDEVYQALIFAKEEFTKIALENKNINIRYRSREIGLEYYHDIKPRPKKLGLVGIYPEKAMIAFGLESWKQIVKSAESIKKLESFPRSIENKEQIIKLILLLREIIGETIETAKINKS